MNSLKSRGLFHGALLLCAGSLFSAEPSKPVFPIADTGSEFHVSFEKYGAFSGRGTNDYKYQITDRAGLEATACECYATIRDRLDDLFHTAVADV